ncbi:hypothetical protein CJJ23_00990 [Mycoplasmopsis agassizii]|uniref:Phosphoesterase n=1 Tax=Mycoplasmopsis agassizii TaxID=33922 RepID=A0A269TKV9_9BACT|nr:YfcE family phosphodiesterase [Mycoplasmopsis agassizii]PAK21696.1 hypothetical protein CJJ23_00990 [Mycoplasmopsis agassizii]
MTKILIVSDIHGDDDDFEKIYAFEKPDYAISAGDHCLSQNFMIKYFNYFVDGNNDWDNFNQQSLDFEIEGFKFHLEHGHRFSYQTLMSEEKMQMIANEHNYNFFITGHSHVQLKVKTNKGYAINPGSIRQKRGLSNAGYAILEIDENKNYKLELKDSSKLIKERRFIWKKK